MALKGMANVLSLHFIIKTVLVKSFKNVWMSMSCVATKCIIAGLLGGPGPGSEDLLGALEIRRQVRSVLRYQAELHGMTSVLPPLLSERAQNCPAPTTTKDLIR